MNGVDGTPKNPEELKQIETPSHANTQLIGLDLGGTKLHAGTTTRQGALGKEWLQPSDTASEASIIAQLMQCVQDLRDERPQAFIALGVPASVDPTTGFIDLSPNVPFSADLSLQAHLSERLGMKVIVENDVNLAALAEARLGAGGDEDLVNLISFGTGVGVGIIANGRVLTGAGGRAGEIAYMPMALGGEVYTAQQEPPHYESLVDTIAIRKRYGKDNPDVRTIFERADAGDSDAEAAIEQTATIAARGVATLQAVLDPDVIIVGGGIGMQKRFFAPLKAEAKALMPYPMKVVQAQLGPSAGMLGALVCAGDAAGLGPITPPPLLQLA